MFSRIIILRYLLAGRLGTLLLRREEAKRKVFKNCKLLVGTLITR